MTDAEKLRLEIDRLISAVEHLTDALIWEKQQNAVLRAEREQFRGALTQANLQMVHMMSFLRGLQVEGLETSVAVNHTLH